MTVVHPTAIVDDGAELGDDVEIGPYSVVGKNVKIGNGSRVLSHVVIDGWTTIGSKCTISPFACLGTQTQDLKYRGAKTFVEIGDGTIIREYVTVNSSTDEGETTRIGAGCMFMAYSHVAHSCEVGDGVIMANCATLAGHVTIGDQVIIGGLSAAHQFVRIGRLCIIGGCTKVIQDCPPFMMVDGNPAQVRGPNSIGLKRKGFDSETQRLVKQVYKIIYRQKLSTSQALDKIRAELEMKPEVQHLVSFIEKTARGITK